MIWHLEKYAYELVGGKVDEMSWEGPKQEKVEEEKQMGQRFCTCSYNCIVCFKLEQVEQLRLANNKHNVVEGKIREQ